MPRSLPEPIVVSDEPCLPLILRDITERKRTEEVLRRNEQACARATPGLKIWLGA